ncbi:MAG: UDP-N-acetylmuramoyl-tripeptide--D-alanyl-D-alanine ligase [Endomicrobium sp.]|nr:UDP-N-acetylmuramoyl-tripeptide--D-alanyl-D-alanine ligase [Endomicrobium sp.]
MESFHLKELIRVLHGKFIVGNPNLLIKGISIDSRTIKKGEAYFAIKGKRYNGHDFINEALYKGAVAIVYSQDIANSVKSFSKFPSLIETNDTIVALGDFAKFYRSKFRNTKIIGITGSNGKTTTKEILASILSKKGKALSNKGNFNNRIGLPLSIFQLTSDVEYAVFEMGTSLHGEIKILSDILKPDEGLITNIGFSHLKTFISAEGVFEEKKILFDNVKEGGCIVINNDNSFLKTIQNTDNHQIVTFAIDTTADVYVKNIELYSNKTDFDLFYKDNSVKVSIHTKGRFNVENALAAASCAIGLGFSLNKIKEGIETFTPPKMRMETLVTSSGVVLINDAYNANPSSIRQAIQAVLQCYAGKKINLVLGDMLELGDKSEDYHFELGKFIANQNITSVALVGNMMINTRNAIGNKDVFYSDNQANLLKHLEQIAVDENYLFLFKGSRDMKLEEIYAKFYSILEQKR